MLDPDLFILIGIFVACTALCAYAIKDNLYLIKSILFTPQKKLNWIEASTFVLSSPFIVVLVVGLCLWDYD